MFDPCCPICGGEPEDCAELGHEWVPCRECGSDMRPSWVNCVDCGTRLPKLIVLVPER